MQFDYSWASVTDPGRAIVYFNLASRPPFDISSNGFRLVNAWYLAEVSRLSYRTVDKPSRHYWKSAFMRDLLSHFGIGPSSTVRW